MRTRQNDVCITSDLTARLTQNQLAYPVSISGEKISFIQHGFTRDLPQATDDYISNLAFAMNTNDIE
jgi:hypothetical protein